MRVPALAGVKVNPVLRRELVERMRGWRAGVILTVYLTLLAGILYIAYRSGQNTDDSPFDRSINQAAGVGRGIFEWLLFLMLMLVLFLVPALTSGAIAGERERQTLLPLQVTLLRPRSIVLGKIGAAMAFLALMIVAALPMLAVCYLIGGVSMGEVLGGVALVLVLALAMACLCTAVSSLVRRVQSATVLAYGLVLFLLVGTLLVRQAASGIDSSRGGDGTNLPSWLLLGNPLATVADVVDDGEDFGNAMETPFDGMEELLHRDEEGGSTAVAVGADAGFGVVQVGPGGQPIQIEVPVGPDGFGEVDRVDEKSPFWWQSLLLLSVVSALAVVVASWRLRTPTRNER
ncbi:MAG: ABC transporter permease [Acidimicrobiales bacterium]